MVVIRTRVSDLIRCEGVGTNVSELHLFPARLLIKDKVGGGCVFQCSKRGAFQPVYARRRQEDVLIGVSLRAMEYARRRIVRPLNLLRGQFL